MRAFIIVCTLQPNLFTVLIDRGAFSSNGAFTGEDMGRLVMGSVMCVEAFLFSVAFPKIFPPSDLDKQVLKQYEEVSEEHSINDNL